jgi:hypothetical protein
MKTLMRTTFLIAVAFASLCMSPSAISTSSTSPNVASASATSPTTPQWIQIRTAYRTALNNNNHISTFETACKSHSQTDALANAYYATALALRARAAIAPTTKLSLANQAEAHLNAAATAQPQNLEIRFLRYSFEYGTPSMLNMKKNMAQDKPLAIKFAKSPSPIKDIAVNFFQKCTDLSDVEKRDIK